MNWSDYIIERRKTDSTRDHFKTAKRMHACMGLCTEAGEICDIMKKHLFYKAPFDLPHIGEELGDLLWYVAQLCDACDLRFEEILAKNIEKLKIRYPNGWNQESAMNRNLTAESTALGK